MNYHHLQYKRGLTLVETIVVVAIFTVLSLAINSSIVAFYRYNAYTIAQANQVSNARRGVELLVRDIREMTYADDGSFPIISMGTSSASFYSDIDRDDSVELVEYELIDTTLYKKIYDASGFPPTYSTTTATQTYIISEYVQNLLQGVDSFTYYDGSGVEVVPGSGDTTEVRYIEVSLIINIDPVRDPGQFMLRSSASLRNLKDNL